MSRQELLGILQRRCADLGVTVHFRTEAPAPERLQADYDLVVAADGARSQVRTAHADVFRPTFETRRCKYMWLGTDLVFEAFKFYVEETPHGVMQIHGYPYDRTGSTFIVEMHDDVWQRAFGDVATLDLPPGESDTKSIELIEQLFAEVLDGHRLFANNSKWLNFLSLRNETWRHGNLVLIGDAAHTAHFSIGSGTKLAMEDALALAACLHEQPDLESALTAYEAERRPVVLSTQRAAQASLEWFEDIGHYVHQAPEQFAFNLVTRSRRVTHDEPAAARPGVRRRHRRVVRAVPARATEPRPPMFHAVPAARPGAEQPDRRLADGHVLRHDGVPTDFHLVHLGSKALGGAGLVMTEMVCVSPEGRITPGCSGLWYGRAGGRLDARRRLRAHRHRREDRCPARPLRAQGLHAAHVGGHRRAAARGQLGGRRPLRAALLPAPTRCRASSRRPNSTSSGTSSCATRRPRHGPGSTCSSCTARTATCCRPSSHR